MGSFHKEPPWLAMARGRVNGVRLANIIGKNNDVDTGTVPEDVWTAGGVYTFPTAAGPMEVVSSSDLDTATGDGLRTAVVFGLNASYQEISEVVSLNGTTPVALVNQYLRINDFRGVAVGASTRNQGYVTVRGAGGGPVYSHMAALAGRAQQTIYTIPAGHTGYVTYGALGVQRSKEEYAEFEILTRGVGGPWVVRNTTTVHSAAAWIVVTPTVPVPFFERSDIRVQVSAVSVSNLVCTCNIQFVLVNNAPGATDDS